MDIPYVAVVAKTFGSPGLNRTEITVSVPHSKLLSGADLYIKDTLSREGRIKELFTG